MTNYNHCDSCVTDRSECAKCKDNPIYKDIPIFSHYRAYIPTCPKGYEDCIYDPAYIKYRNSEWYKSLYGDLTPEQASKKSCAECFKEDSDYYDNEDK